MTKEPREAMKLNPRVSFDPDWRKHPEKARAIVRLLKVRERRERERQEKEAA